MADIYREWALPDRESMIDSFWQSHVGAATQHRVIPDGCFDIVFVQGKFTLVGPMTEARCVEMGAGENIFGVRFRPGASQNLLGLQMSEICDELVAAEEVTSTRHLSSLANAINQQPLPLQREAFVAAMVEMTASVPTPSSAITHAIAQLERDPTVPMEVIAKEVGWSTRHLRRRFLHDVGYSPRIFARIIRFIRFSRMVKATPSCPLPLAEIASQCGYADQSHLTRECKTFTHLTPMRFLAEMSETFKIQNRVEGRVVGI